MQFLHMDKLLVSAHLTNLEVIIVEVQLAL
jgi:hypothetical protein